jgi:hypothetical protein
MKRLIITSLFATAALFAQTGATGSTTPAPKASTSTNAPKHHKAKKSTAASKTSVQTAAKPVSK